MATGRIGVTPTLGVRWSKAPTGGTTALSGLDDSSVSLVYSVGYEQVYRNGVLLSRGNDYTATTGTTITLIDATITGDIIEVFAQQLVPLADAISKGQFTAKGTLLSATAASTPGVLGVGANDTVLTADSAEATGLKWATPAAGGMTLLSTTTLSGASVTISGISQSYKSLVGYIRLPLPSTDGAALRLRPNNVSTTSYFNQFEGTGFTATAADATEVRYAPNTDNATTNGFITFEIFDYADTTHYKMISALAQTTDQSTPATQINGRNTVAYLFNNSAITSLVVFFDSGNMTSGTLLLYGVS